MSDSIISDAMNRVNQVIDEQHADKSAHTRRQLVAGAGVALGGMGLLSLPGSAMAGGASAGNTPENILNLAATVEVLATIVNTVGPERVDGIDAVTLRNIRAASREELIHYQVLTSSAIGAKSLTKKIWIPNAVFRNETSLLNTLVTGDQIFVNAYLIGTTAFGNAGNGRLARVAAEFMAVESVHRALALQSLGKLGNDRVFARYDFTSINTAVSLLQDAGFGFGKRGKGAGRFYDFNEVQSRTPNPNGLTQRAPA